MDLKVSIVSWRDYGDILQKSYKYSKNVSQRFSENPYISFKWLKYTDFDHLAQSFLAVVGVEGEDSARLETQNIFFLMGNR